MRLEEEIRSTKPLMPRQRAVLNILFTASQIECEINRQLRPYQLTNPQYNIMRILKGSAPKGLSVLDIKSRMLDRSSNVSRLVEKLRERGLVERTTAKEDRRAVVVTITQAGIELADTITNKYFNSEKHLSSSQLTDEEHSLLADLLDRFRV
jgi:MarR family transcriptional regulator, 2-MHQ and catechol-resistance regulon repressor